METTAKSAPTKEAMSFRLFDRTIIKFLPGGKSIILTDRRGKQRTVSLASERSEVRHG